MFKDIMEEYQGLVQVKTCDTELGAGPVGGANNNNNTKFSRCEGCGELIMDRCSDTFISDNKCLPAFKHVVSAFHILDL